MKFLTGKLGLAPLALVLGSYSVPSLAVDCTGVAPWQTGTAYTKDMTATQSNNKYRANWWTNNSPATHSGQWQDWTLEGACDSNALDALLANPANSQLVDAPSVRVFYMVPSNERRNSDFVKALYHANKHMQDYYLKQVDNQKTFSFKRPNAPVEVIGTDKTASWFRDNNPNNSTNWVSWGNARDELARIVGQRPANERWVVYVDSEPVCDQNSGGAADGVAIMFREDMLGLINQSHLATCSNHVWNGPYRWVGGLAHEAGHTFNLPHDENCDACLMWTGYTIYPNTILRENTAGLPVLRTSEFFTRLPQINAVFAKWEQQQALTTTATRQFVHQGKTLYFRQYTDNRFFVAHEDNLYQVVNSVKDNKGSITSVFVGLGNTLNPESADYLSAIANPVDPQ